MRGIFLLLITLAACTSRTERIHKRLVLLNSDRDSLNIQYGLLQNQKDSLRHISANARQKYGKPDSLAEVRFFECERKIKAILDQQNTVGMQIKELELLK
jgi:hypothetical protein